MQYSAALYQTLEAETGLSTGYKQCGGVTVARTPGRMIQPLRTAPAAEAFNLECEILYPQQALDRYPRSRNPNRARPRSPPAARTSTEDGPWQGTRGGITPPASPNQRTPVFSDTPAASAAATADNPDRTNSQNSRRTISGYPGGPNIATPHQLRCCIDTLNPGAVLQPQLAARQCEERRSDKWLTASAAGLRVA